MNSNVPTSPVGLPVSLVPPLDAATQAQLALLDAQRELLVAAEQQLVQMRWSLLSHAADRLAPAPPAAVALPTAAPALPPPPQPHCKPTPQPQPSAEPAVSPAAPSSTAPSPPASKPPMPPQRRRQWLIAVAVVAVALAAAGVYAWTALRDHGPGPGFASGNGRIEATEVDVATKLAGRVDAILVDEGDFVRAGQQLATMQVQVLDARRDEAAARRQQAITAVAAAQAQVALRASDKVAMQALVDERLSALDAAERRLARSSTLAAEGASSQQELDDDRARVGGAQAGVAAARAQVVAAQAGVHAARAQVVGAQSGVGAADATLASVQADITDSRLTAPRDGRVQYRVAQPGEVLPGGGKVLNIVDLSDVTMTFFMPEAVAGRLALGSEVHVVLDAAPQYVIPARVSFVASTAQFTPKTVETASERQKLMFRVKARLDRNLLQKHLKQVKTGLPGVAWLKLDANAAWPAELAVKLPP